MIRRFLVLAALCVVPVVASAQSRGGDVAVVPSPIPVSTMVIWDMPAGVDVDGYRLIVDGERRELGAVAALPGMKGLNGTDLVYGVPFPALTPGNHILVVEAYNDAGQEASAELQLRVIVKPTAPLNPRLLQQNSFTTVPR